MALPAFTLHRPDTVAEALALLEEHGEDAAFYMGGTELLLLMKLGFAEPRHLVDGKRLAELRGLSFSPDAVQIGAGVTHRRLERHADLRRTLPTLSLLEGQVANVRVRNVGTIGGNLCFAEPHSDPVTLLTALEAEVTLLSRAGSRVLPLAEFGHGAFQTALRPGEIMTQLRVPLPAEGTRVGYERLAFKERPDVTVAVVLAEDGCRVYVGALSGRPIRVPDAERALAEHGADGLADAVSATTAAVAEVDRAEGGDYRAHLAGVLVGRACASARAGSRLG